jgi:methylmalonic aciduria homocystinuria type C protein
VTTFEDIVEALSARVGPPGFEVLGAVNVGAYNATLDAKHDGLRLPELAGARDAVLLVGNTRRLWPLFLEAYATTALGAADNPLDDYSRWHVGDAALAVAAELGLRHAIRYSFEPEPRGVAIHRLALLSGFAELSPVGLCVHPDHGPWFSMRAAVVFDVEGPAPRAASPTCSACTSRPCLAAREEMLATSGGVFDRATFLAHWRAWLAMRDACPIGRDARYGEQQIRYHYSKDRAVLDAAREDAELRLRRP